MTNLDITALSATLKAAEAAGRAAHAEKHDKRKAAYASAAATLKEAERLAASDPKGKTAEMLPDLKARTNQRLEDVKFNELQKFVGINMKDGNLVAIFEIWIRYGETMTIAIPIAL
jgi:hypothetical protein